MENIIHSNGGSMSGNHEHSSPINQRSLQLLIAMKIFLILLAFSLHVSAAALSQQITLSVKKAPLREVMQSISKQSGYNFLFKNSLTKEAKPVTITLSDIPIEKALEKIFEGQPFSYKIDDKSIVISPKKDSSDAPPPSHETEPIIIKGRVTDKNNKPLPGVNIRIKGSPIGTVTDVNGNYILKTNGPGTLLFSYIGFRSYEQKVNKKSEINISLEDISAQLDQVQVIAYGTTTKRYSTSNIATIKGEDIAKQPISNVLLGLQGRAPGIFLGQSTGVAGGDIKVRVQGENSLRKGNEAFYVIDGIPYTPQNLYSGINLGAMPGSGSALNFLNPSDVESIEILKDADATAIYGSRAANGAILITTKKGKSGRTKVDLNTQSGLGKVPTKTKLLNTEEYITMRSEAFKNGNSSPGPTDYDMNGLWDKNRYTDWQKELIGNTSHYTNIQATISGGNDETQFSAGGGYIKETTVFPGDFSDTKVNVRMNINHNSKNKKFEFNINSNYLQDLNKLPTTDLTSAAITLPPNAPTMYNEDGSINWQVNPSNNNSETFSNNPATYLLRKYRAKTNNLLGNTLIGYKILPELMLKASLGYNRLQTEEINIAPQTSFPPSSTINNRTATYGDKNITSWIIEPQLTYLKTFRFGNINALIGSSFQATDNNVMAFDGTNYPGDDQLENSLAAGNITPNINTMQSKYRYNAIFGRLNYQLKNKYIFNFSIRRDGSSRFGSENLFHTFYSVGGAWILSDENWFKSNLNSISFAKLRVTYGTTGNDQISDYQFLNLYNNYTSNVINRYQQSVGILPTGHSNPYIQWEETKKLNFGLDIGLFENKIMLNANYYRNISSNQLLGYNLPFLTGFPTVLRNIPATVQNTGLELQIESTPVNTIGFKWQISSNLTIPRSRLTKYPNLDQTSDADSYILGESPNIMRVYDFAGVNKETGLYQFKTSDGKITTSPDYEKDRTKFVDLGQKFYGGINNIFSYNNFELSFLFQFVKQMSTNYKFGTYWPGIMVNQPSDILNRWQQPNDIKEIQRVSTGYEELFTLITANSSNAAYSDASYIRLKSANISYSLPQKLLEKIRFSGMRIYLQGQNLITITKYKWGDPEIGRPGILPALRVITTGIQLTF